MSLKTTKTEKEKIESSFKDRKYRTEVMDNYIELTYVESVLASLEALRIVADSVDELDYLNHWNQVLFFLENLSLERTPFSFSPRLPEKEVSVKQETARKYLERMFENQRGVTPVFEGYPTFAKKVIKDVECCFEGYRMLFMNCKRSAI